MQDTAGDAIFRKRGFLSSFFVRQDAVYNRWAESQPPLTGGAKFLYLALYLLPGLLAAVAINVHSIFEVELRLTHLSPRYLQLAWMLLITFGWHMFSPFVLLRFADRLSFRDSLSYVGLDRIDLKGLFVILPIFCLGFALASVPYMQLVWVPLHDLCQRVPLFHIPSWSIFGGDPKGLYAFPPLALLLLFLGNFIGEELYFRAYLMKKTSFLGTANWWVNSLLFALYHLWQIPQTWPLAGMVFAFGLLMQLRKDTYLLIAFHLFVNMWLMYGEYPLARAVHLTR